MQSFCDSHTTLEEIKHRCCEFRDARDWKRFHNPKDLALALSCESAEILELFRFKDVPTIECELASDDTARSALGDEMSDVLYFLLTLADHVDIDLSAAFERKMRKNEEHYPVDLARGKNLKYTELGTGTAL